MARDEDSVAWTQLAWNRECVAVCQQCACALPSSSWWTSGADEEGGVQDFMCRLGCGMKYCSERCLLQAEPAHSMLCCGPVEEDHPRYLFKIAALNSENCDVYMLAAKWLAFCSLQQGLTGDNHPVRASADAVPFWELHENVKMEEVENMWDLLRSGAGGDFSDVYESVSVVQFGKILSFVVFASCPISMPSIYEKQCRVHVHKGSASPLPQPLRDAILACRATVEDDVHESISDSLSDAQIIDRVLMSPEYFFEKVEMLVMCNAVFSLSHSCIPNSKVECFSASDSERPSLRAKIVRLRSIGIHEPLSIARVDCADCIAERRESLRCIGQACPCACARCKFEDGLADSLAMDELRIVFEEARKDERYDDAGNILEEILKRAPNDAEALYERARLAGWNDQWSESFDLMTEAASIVSGHKGIATCIADRECYYCGNERHDDVDVAENEVSDIFFSENLLDAGECTSMICLAEEYLNGKWTTERHFKVPTTDVPVRKVRGLLEWFNEQLKSKIFPSMGRHFKVNPSSLRIIDAFLVKYEEGAQRSLPLHCDQSEFSLTVAMNSKNDYVGGGTYFARTCDVANADVGGMVGFRGHLLHAGYPVQAGVRYIIVVFSYCQR